MIPYNHLRRKHSQDDDLKEEDEDFQIDFQSVQAGSEFAIFQDSQKKLYGIGNCEWGQMLNKGPKKYKRLKRIVPRHDSVFEDFRSVASQFDNLSHPEKTFHGNQLELEQVMVGKKNVLVSSQIKKLKYDQMGNEYYLHTQRKIFCWGCSSNGELGVDFLKEEFVSQKAQEVSIEGILQNADTDKLIVGLSDQNPQVVFDDYAISQLKRFGGKTLAAAQYKLRNEKNETLTIGKISSGQSQTLILINETLYSIGRKKIGSENQLPLIMTLSTKILVKGLSCGYEHSALFDFDGQIYTWGWSQYGRLGHPNQYGVFKPEDYEPKPRKVLSLDSMNIVGIALGETYSAFLNVKGEIYVIGKIAPIRENLSNDMEYIKPIKCDPISKNRKAWIVKIRSGRKHLVCVDRDYKLYSFGMNHDGCLGSEEYNALANPKHIPELNTNDQKIVDFDCGDYFTVVITEAGNINFDAQIYRDFKYDSSQKIVRRIFYEGKKGNMEPDQTLLLSSDQVTKYPLPNQQIVEGIEPEYGFIETKKIQSLLMRKDTVLQFHRTVLPTQILSRKVSLESLTDTVKQFFGVIDFTELPLQLLQTPEQQRIKNLKQRVFEVVEQMVSYSDDFKTYMSNFQQIVKSEGMHETFENIFFEQILKNPLIKKVIGGKQIKRQKQEQVFVYGKRGKQNKLYADALKSQSDIDGNSTLKEPRLEPSLALQEIYRDGLTVNTYNSWKSGLNKNSLSHISQKEMFDPIKSVVDRRYAPFDPQRCKYKPLGPVTQSQQNTTRAITLHSSSSLHQSQNLHQKNIGVSKSKIPHRVSSSVKKVTTPTAKRPTLSTQKLNHANYGKPDQRPGSSKTFFGNQTKIKTRESENSIIQEDPKNEDLSNLQEGQQGLKTIRIKRVKSSQVAQRRYQKMFEASEKRMVELQLKKANENQVHINQKILQIGVNKERAKEVKILQKVELNQKLDKKYGLNQDEERRMRMEEAMHLTRLEKDKRRGREMTRLICTVQAIDNIGKLLPVLGELRNLDHQTKVAKLVIEIGRKKFRVKQLIKSLNIRQRFLLAWTAKKMKDKVRVLRAQKALKKISTTLILDAKVRKKMRLGLGGLKAKIQKYSLFLITSNSLGSRSFTLIAGRLILKESLRFEFSEITISFGQVFLCE